MFAGNGDKARGETDLEWVTLHTFRKTVATLIDKESDTKSAAAQPGHVSEQLGANRGRDDHTRAPSARNARRSCPPTGVPM
jgi:integrase